MEKYNKIPLVYLTIDDDDESGVDFVSLVDEPAIERDFHAFAKVKEPYKFKIENKEKRIITGPFMIANLPIYRRWEDKEWYVVFTSDVIRKIVYKFMKKGMTKAVNEMHGHLLMMCSYLNLGLWMMSKVFRKDSKMFQKAVGLDQCVLKMMTSGRR